MPKRSAGLLAYRRADGGFEVLLVHPGGPYWRGKDDGAWSIPKGEHDPDEDPLEVAIREFREELGADPPDTGTAVPLGEHRQPSGKLVTAWAIEGDVDVSEIHSNTFEMEWPPRSGRTAQFPEVDRAGWFAPDEARRKLLRGQVILLDRLARVLEESVQDG
ncbi:MAG TPA: NUDIX domain-containing protein [Actinomycetota bacterium]|nr:NUDIX domain-containing protein [Actinomycetota bacterium]